MLRSALFAVTAECVAYDKVLTAGRKEAEESFLDDANDTAQLFCRLEEEVNILTSETSSLTVGSTSRNSSNTDLGSDSHSRYHQFSRSVADSHAWAETVEKSHAASIHAKMVYIDHLTEDVRSLRLISFSSHLNIWVSILYPFFCFISKRTCPQSVVPIGRSALAFDCS